MARNPRIDQLRGLLIAFVVLGHIVVGSVHENVIRYAIYAFHMPVFIALSGYLINIDTLRSASISTTLWRYWLRALKPFTLAFLFFTGVLAVHAVQENRYDSQLLLSAISTPYYHLWFVPTLVLWVIGLVITLKLRIPIWFALLASVCVSLLWAAVGGDHLPNFIAAITSKKLVYFLSFFLLGVQLRAWQKAGGLQNNSPYYVAVLGVIALFGFALYMHGIGVDKTPLKAVSWYALNLCLFLIGLIYIGLWNRANAARLNSNDQGESALASLDHRSEAGSKLGDALEMMGRLSLPIYLWHVLPLFLLKGFDVHETALLLYYALSLVGSLLIIWLVQRYENKSPLLDRWFYGVPAVANADAQNQRPH